MLAFNFKKIQSGAPTFFPLEISSLSLEYLEWRLFSVPAVEPWVGRPVGGAAGTFGMRCAFVAESAAGAAAVAAAAASAGRRPPAACAAGGAGPG